MEKVIIDAVESLKNELKKEASTLGIAADYIKRTYSPSKFVEEMEQGVSYLAVYFQNNVEIEREELRAGAGITIPIRLGVCKKIGAVKNEQIDPAVNIYETLQNRLISEHWQWEGGKGVYTLEEATPAVIVDPDFLEQLLVVFCAIDIKISIVNTY